MSARMTMTHRRPAPVLRLVMGTAPQVARPAALVARQRFAAVLVEGTSLDAGEANRRTMVRARRARRLMRAATMPLILGLALASGLAIGRMGQGTRAVRTIAPTRQPVNRPVSMASILPLALIPAAHTTN